MANHSDVEYYSDEDDEEYGSYYFDKDEDEDVDDGFDSKADDDHQQTYTIMSEADIRRCQEEDVNHLSNTLSILTTDSIMLLRHYNWNVSKVHDEWLSDEAKVREAVGLLLEEEPAAIAAAAAAAEVSKSSTLDEVLLLCKICFEEYSCGEMSAAASCGHRFCQDCWRGYISASINKGPGCLTLRCPDPSCAAAVRTDMVELLVSEEDMNKYSRYLLRSYVEDNKKIKWCPGPNCEFAVSFLRGGASCEVVCQCTHAFCWNCGEEPHRPVDCETVAKWALKNKAEANDTMWMLVNSKPCPKCKWPIEKDQGCMHMTCRCGYQFCWLCLVDWTAHGKKTGGFYACNMYETAREKAEFDEEEMHRSKARESLARYTHYYERWASHRESAKRAHQDLQNMRGAEKLEELRTRLNLPELVQVKFVVEAYEQIVECRRVLTWTYAYGYFLPEEGEQEAKKRLFEYLQGHAEAGLERLHKCAEEELQAFLNADDKKKMLIQ